MVVSRRQIVVLFAAGFGVSALFNVLVMGIWHGQESDGVLYLRMAQDIWGYLSESSIARQPVFPLLLAGLRWMTGDAMLVPVARFALSALSGVNCVLLTLLACRLWGRREGVVAGLAAGVYPNLFYWSAFLLTETVGVTMFLLLLHALLRLRDAPGAATGALTGLVAGVALLTRAALQVCIPFLAVWLVIALWDRRKQLGTSLAAAAVAAAAVQAPWAVRNLVVVGRLVPIADNGGIGLYGGNNPDALTPQGHPGNWDGEAAVKLLPEMEGMDRGQRDAFLRGRAFDFVKTTLEERPADFARLEYLKLRSAWFPWPGLPRSVEPQALFNWAFAAAFVLASLAGIAGALLALRGWRRTGMLHAALAGHTLQTLVFFGEMHYRVLFEPILLALGALAAVWSWDRVRRRIGPIRASAASGVVVLAGMVAVSGTLVLCNAAAAPTGAEQTALSPPGMRWVPVPAGTFLMGCSPGDGRCRSDERPAHTVAVERFEMLETEVTEAQYAYVAERMGWNAAPSGDFNVGGGPDSPVERVTWQEARAFCAALGMGARLPTEAEWEYAARAGNGDVYSCGADPSCLDATAWYDGNSDDLGMIRKHDVRRRAPNAYGLYDMGGNVWEWVEDCWHDSYEGAPALAGLPWDRGCREGYAVERGGSFMTSPGALRSSARRMASKEFRLADKGFRCAAPARGHQ